MTSSYRANDIQTLSAGRGFRERIGMYLSADRQEAIDLGLRELIYNAQDEYEATKQKDGFIKITIDTKTNQICAEDNLRGIPVGVRSDGINSLTAALLLPHSGAKYDDKTAYGSSAGCNGEGLKIVCHTSEWLKAEIKRDGKIYFQSFHETDEGAVANEDVTVIGETNSTGTKITYVPSKIVYGADTKIDIQTLYNTLKQLSFFSKGFKIILVVDGKETIFHSVNGLMDGLDTKNAMSKPFQYFYKTDDCEVELALQWVKKKGKIRGYANGLYMSDGGAFISSFKSSLTRTFNNLANKKFDGDSIRNLLDGFVSVKVHVGQFSNQAKTALANKEAASATSTAVNELLKDFYQKRRNDFEAIVVYLDKLNKAEEAADRAREKVLLATAQVEKNQKKKVFSSDKLKDAEFLGQDSTLLIVEGDSAASSMAMARDIKKYGILAIRGKILNCLSNTEDKIFENEEINLLLSAMNIIPGKYNASKLRYGKIAICTDSDSDGYHIGLLIMAALRYLAPKFLDEGRLCWLRSPLYIVKNGKNESYYFTDEEMDAARPTIKGEIQRNKGLGSLSPSQARESMFNEKNQRIDVLIPDEDSIFLLEELMGESVEPRRDFIFSNVDFSEIRE